MTKAEWISVIKHTMMKIDEQGIYREPLLERHIQSVYEQMFNELYNQDKTKIWHYVRDYSISNTLVHNDWYLPMPSDMESAYSLISEGEDTFWTSGEASASNAYTWTASGPVSTPKSTSAAVWPIRTFTGAIGEYSLSDMGPAGGIIVLAVGTTYNEMAPTALSAAAWSNVTDALVGVGAFPFNGLTASNSIISQDGHTASAAQDCLSHVVGEASSSVTLSTLPVSFNRRGGGVFSMYSDNQSFIITDRQGYMNSLNTLFDTAGIKGSYYAYISGDKIYSDEDALSWETVYVSIVPKFTSLGSTDEVLIPGGAEDHFIDRVIDTIKHMTPVDLFNDNTVQ